MKPLPWRREGRVIGQVRWTGRSCETFLLPRSTSMEVDSVKIRTAILFTTITLLALGGCQETPEPVAEPVPAPPAPVELEPEPAEPEEPAPAPTPKVVAAPARGVRGNER